MRRWTDKTKLFFSCVSLQNDCCRRIWQWPKWRSLHSVVYCQNTYRKLLGQESQRNRRSVILFCKPQIRGTIWKQIDQFSLQCCDHWKNDIRLFWEETVCTSTRATISYAACLMVTLLHYTLNFRFFFHFFYFFLFIFCQTPSYCINSYFTATSEDGSTVLLLKKDLRKKSMASKPTGKRKIIDKNTFIEAQSMMHVCRATKCLVVFMDPSNHLNYALHEIDYDEVFFQTKMADKLTDFFENFIWKKVSTDDIHVKV